MSSYPTSGPGTGISGYPADGPGTRTTDPALRPGTRMTANTVWPMDDTQRPTPSDPLLAMVLVPRDPTRPTWVFPFNRPAPPGPGDNQSMAIATRDGSVVYDVAFALVTTTKDTVLNANEAYAFASCSHCAAVAVSFQVVLVVGNAHGIAPQNVSAAVAYNCISCVTAAVAIQLDVSLTSAPHGSTAARLAALWKQVRAFGRHIASFSLAEIRAQLHKYEQQVEQILQPLRPGSTPNGVPTPLPSGGGAASSRPPSSPAATGTGVPSSSTSAPGTTTSVPSSTTTAPGSTSTAPPSDSPTSAAPSAQPSSSPSDTGSATSAPSSSTAAPSSNPATSSTP